MSIQPKRRALLAGTLLSPAAWAGNRFARPPRNAPST